MNRKGPRQIGEFRVEELLGRGGMGAVYRAYNTRERRYVALKLMLETDDDHHQGDRFAREARLLCGIEHPHVVPVHSYGEIDGRMYLEMELIEAEDLSKVLAKGLIPPARAVTIVEHVAAALDAVHALHLVHRDVKPANILLTAAGGGTDHAYLVDFGIARSTVDPTRLTATGMVVGTVNYVAPEVIRGHTATVRSDVYALGCVLYECLTGVQAFPGVEYAVMQAHMDHTPVPPSQLVPGLPGALDDVVARALAKDPAERTTSAPALSAAARLALMPGRRHTRSAMPVWDSTEPGALPGPPGGDLAVTTIPVQVGATVLPASEKESIPPHPGAGRPNPPPTRPAQPDLVPDAEAGPPPGNGAVPEELDWRPRQIIRTAAAHDMDEGDTEPVVGTPGRWAPRPTKLGMPSEEVAPPILLPAPLRRQMSGRAKEQRFLVMFTATAVLLAAGLVVLTVLLWRGVL